MMQFTPEEWYSFAHKLSRATDAGRVDWDMLDSDFSNNAFLAVVPGNAAYTIYSRDGDGQFPYILKINDLEGNPISDFTTVAYFDVFDLQAEHRASMVIESLYQDVARLVTGAPQKAQSLLAGLEALAPEEDPF